MSEKSKTSIVKSPKKDTSVDTFISQAITANVPVETMERLFALKKEVKAEQAREEFVRAISGFQSECPVIEKTKKVLNKDGSLRYQFAPIDSIVKQIQTPLAKYELAYTWKVLNDPGFITAVCTITHSMGHSETSDFKIPIDTEGYMTAPQKYASALTFAKRYSLCNALGISTGDEDVDATDQHKDAEPKSDKAKIMFLLKTLKIDTTTKETISRSVLELTQLELIEKNYGEIVARLEEVIKERQEYDNSQVS